MLEINKIHCGDCLELMKQIDDNSVDLVLTDPPYLISIEGKHLDRSKLRLKTFRRKSKLHSDFGKWDIQDKEKYKEFIKKVYKEIARVLKIGGWCYIWFAKEKVSWFYDFNFLKYKTVLVWEKSNAPLTFIKNNWRSVSEFCWVACKEKGSVKNFISQEEMKNVLHLPNITAFRKERTTHTTQKPLKLFSKLIKVSSNPNDIVLDPFIGSGTTAVACKQLNRNFIGIEISPEYCEIANKRLEQSNLNKWKEEVK